MATPIGHIVAGTFVLWARRHRLCGGFLKLCGRAVGTGPGAVPEPFVLVDEYTLEQRRPTPCSAVFGPRRPKLRTLLHPADLKGTADWLDGGNAKIRVVIPPAFRTVRGV